MKTLIFLITIIAATSLVRAGEIVPVWNQEWDINPNGHARLLDIDFLKGEEQFIMIGVDGEIGTIEVRATQTGEQIKSIQVENLIEGNEIGVTPDSTRFLMSVGFLGENNAALELRNIDDLSLIRKYEMSLEGDSLGELGSYYRNRILSMRIDPVKPYVYFILEKKLIGGQFGDNHDFYAIKVYNYETMEEIKELRTYKNDYMKSLDVSHDGKYLAYVDEGEAYINIWDLETFENIRNYKISQYYKDIPWETDISAFQFSKLNSQTIYFSGLISDKNEPNKPDNGVFEYSIERGNHINRLPENGYSGGLIFAEDEKILFLNPIFELFFFNFTDSTLELSFTPEFKERIGLKTRYSKKNKFFVGESINSIKAFQYLTQSIVKSKETEESIIFPNPTTNSIQIEALCELNEVKLELLDVNGALLRNESIAVTGGYVSFDLSEFQSGSYFIRLTCNDQISTYNVVKEG